MTNVADMSENEEVLPMSRGVGKVTEILVGAEAAKLVEFSEEYENTGKELNVFVEMFEDEEIETNKNYGEVFDVVIPEVFEEISSVDFEDDKGVIEFVNGVTNIETGFSVVKIMGDTSQFIVGFDSIPKDAFPRFTEINIDSEITCLTCSLFESLNQSTVFVFPRIPRPSPEPPPPRATNFQLERFKNNVSHPEKWCWNDLKQLAIKLLNVKEFSVDLEYNQYRSFHGLTCFMQIFPRTENFIIDTLELRNHIGPYLREVFKDPTKRKALHRADCDIVWLQRDFKIYICNMFDTGQASRVLKLERYSLDYMLSHFCEVTTKKEYQNADWRTRPLSREMIKYTGEDTQYLSYIYDLIRIKLLSLFADSESENSYLHIYGVQNAELNAQPLEVVYGLYEWRDVVACAEDESTGCVLPNRSLIEKTPGLQKQQEKTTGSKMNGMTKLCYRVTKTDVIRAHNKLESSMFLHLDRTFPVAEDIGRQLLTHGRRILYAELFAEIDFIDAKIVIRVAKRFIFDKRGSKNTYQSMVTYNSILSTHFFLKLIEVTMLTDNDICHHSIDIEGRTYDRLDKLIFQGMTSLTSLMIDGVVNVDTHVAIVMTKSAIQFINCYSTRFEYGIDYRLPTLDPGGDIARVLLANSSNAKVSWEFLLDIMTLFIISDPWGQGSSSAGGNVMSHAISGDDYGYGGCINDFDGLTKTNQGADDFVEKINDDVSGAKWAWVDGPNLINEMSLKLLIGLKWVDLKTISHS